MEHLATGKPLFVSAYKSDGMFEDLFSVMVAETGLKETGESEFFHVQHMPPEDQLKLIMSSAALPVVFDSQKICGKYYRDGSIGGWQTQQGNTPVTPLKNAGCKWAVVVHLTDGSLWDRSQFDQNMNIIEIRPEKPIHPEGSVKSLMDFSSERTDKWIEQGYEDAARCLGNVISALRLAHMAEIAEKELDTIVSGLMSDDFDEKLKLL
ncbi:phospholipase [Desulfonema ishimotonii]|uniref:Phospholipase n=1 Tax=Desulfonema ishimotonii TaxID=45657 RepID=A0A401FQF3_9BACT|nr:hypothetical protein [Desulfonema ishimotonii]GBC59213.1 phospholipase [Desulfonema ishimotonii]